MTQPTTPLPTPVLDALLCRLAQARPMVRQERTFTRLRLLTLASLLALGRHTLTQLLVVLGVADQDWSAWYRLFNRGRLAPAAGERAVVAELLASTAAAAPLPVVLDATQLPRSSARFPGAGLTRAPRSPAWRPGLHLAQRVEIVSGLLPRSAAGDSRAVPLQATVLRSPRTQPLGATPEQSEGAAALSLLHWLRATVDGLGEPQRPVLALGDGAYSTAPLLRGVPAHTTLLARCAKNRALYALPEPEAPRRGRKRLYGVRGATPQATLHDKTGWQTVTVQVRGRTIPLTVKVTGPWVVHGAAQQPGFLLVVKGIEQGSGTSRRQRDPQFYFVTAIRAEPTTTEPTTTEPTTTEPTTTEPTTTEPTEEWQLPWAVDELLSWAWQRWEVEVMHRELKSSCGLGEQQAWSPTGASTTLAWALWSYALLILSGYAVWGLGPASGPAAGPALGRWWRPRRWSVGRLLQEVRTELWHSAECTPVWTRSPDAWPAMEAWLVTQTNAAHGTRRL